MELFQLYRKSIKEQKGIGPFETGSLKDITNKIQEVIALHLGHLKILFISYNFTPKLTCVCIRAFKLWDHGCLEIITKSHFLLIMARVFLIITASISILLFWEELRSLVMVLMLSMRDINPCYCCALGTSTKSVHPFQLNRHDSCENATLQLQFYHCPFLWILGDW